jgi:hypothetical protein
LLDEKDLAAEKVPPAAPAAARDAAPATVPTRDHLMPIIDMVVRSCQVAGSVQLGQKAPATLASSCRQCSMLLVH